MLPLLADVPFSKGAVEGTPSTISGMTGLAVPGVLAMGLSTHGAEGGENMISSSSAAGLAIQDDRPEITLGGPIGVELDVEDPNEWDARSGTAIGAELDGRAAG